MKIRNYSTWGIIAGVAILLSTLHVSTSFARRPPQTARGITFGAAYIQYWDGACTPRRDLISLPCNRSIVNNFVSQMQKYGASRTFLFGNHSVWSTDLTDVNKNEYGRDHVYADTVDLYVYQGHGGVSGSSIFGASMCLPSSWKTWSEYKISKQRTFYSNQARFNQRLRWLILSTCHSLETRPDLVWKRAAGPGFEYIIGYRGLSYSAPSTDEVLEDWVINEFKKGFTFKQAWFDAADDWFFAQTPSVIAFGESYSSATSRRDSLRHHWSRRNGGEKPVASAWAWKQWGGVHPARRTQPERRDWNYFSTN